MKWGYKPLTTLAVAATIGIGLGWGLVVGATLAFWMVIGYG